MNSPISSLSQKILLGIFAILFAGQPAIIGLTLSSYIPQPNIVGDFYAAIATLLFLANALGLNADRFISIQLNRLKLNYSNALRSNYLYLLKFFLLLFFLIAVVALVGDIVLYFLFRFSILTSHDKITHPVELCFFCIFFFMTANFMASFLRGIGHYDTVVRSTIVSILARLIIFYLVLANHYSFDLQLEPGYNEVFTLVFIVSACEIIRIFLFSITIFKYLAKIVDQHPGKIDRTWQQDIFYYFLYSMQYDLILTFIIITEIFGRSENAPGLCGYIFATVRAFQVLGVIFHNLIRDSVAKSLVLKNNFEKLTLMIILSSTLIIIVLLIFTIVFIDQITLSLHIYQFRYFVIILVCITAIKSIIDALFSIVIFATRKTMKSFTLISTLIFSAYIVISIHYSSLSFNLALWTFIAFYSIFTTIEILTGIRMFIENKPAKIFARVAQIPPER